MRRNIFLLLILLIFVSFACKDDLTNYVDYSFIMEDHSSNQYQFPPGIYYEYTLEDANSYNFNEIAVLQEIRNSGIQMKDACNKNYSSSCTPPGSNISMMVIVPAEFLIRLKRNDTRLISFGFAEISVPNISFCSYRVKHYSFN